MSSMMKTARIALVGDYSPDITAHVAINQAVRLFDAANSARLETIWIPTASLHPGDESLFTGADGIWCVPGSPYANTDGAIWAIQYARTKWVPFLGTCGGYQHALLEYARNVLGQKKADHAELHPETEFALLTKLSCPLVEESEKVLLTGRSRLRSAHGDAEWSLERYRCRYGLNPAYESLFQDFPMLVAARSPQGEVRAVELTGHPFFIGVGYQPERRSLEGEVHPLVAEFFLRAMSHAVGSFIRQATPEDTDRVVAILREAAQWVEANGPVMWRDSELIPERLAADVEAGSIYLAERHGEPAGTIKFQLDDALFWPDVPPGESAFVHRLAVRRRFAGMGMSRDLLDWAAKRARSLGKRWLRLDCEASRPKLRAFYENFGFRHHSDRQVGPYFVSRYELDLGTYGR